MTPQALIYAGGFDFVGVIIFLVVLSKIIAAVKNASASGRQTKTDGTEGRNVASDLEKFFQGLAEGKIEVQDETPPGPPPLPAAAMASHSYAKRAASSGTRPPIAERRPDQTRKTYPGYAPGTDRGFSITSAIPKRAMPSASAPRPRLDIMKMLKDNQSTRKAVVLREILGPPVSMRN